MPGKAERSRRFLCAPRFLDLGASSASCRRLLTHVYLKLIEKHCTNALNILDRFHVVAKLNLALDEVRASEARRLVQDGYEPVLKKSRWCLLKRRENLTGKQRVKLRDVLRYNLQSVRA